MISLFSNYLVMINNLVTSSYCLQPVVYVLD